MSENNKKVPASTELEYKVLKFNAKEQALELIKKDGQKSVLNTVIEYHRNEEFNRRVNIIKNVIVKYNTLKAEVDKIKPDVEGTYTSAGVFSGMVYSKQKYEEKTNKIKEINRIVEAMELFEKNNDFSGLDKFEK